MESLSLAGSMLKMEHVMSFLLVIINASKKVLQDLPTAVQLENISGNSRPQFVCIEKDTVYCNEM